jgi:hypothetical protein
MKKACVVVLIIVSTLNWKSTSAQAFNDEASVKDVLTKVFKAMELGDSAMLRTAFYSQVTTVTVARDKNGNTVLRSESSVDGFAKAVGTPHKEVWHEDIWDVKVQLDGDFAQAWCDYSFHHDKTFIHCGVDAFHLIKTKEGWKIFHLADTRRKTGCNLPKEILDKYK